MNKETKGERFRCTGHHEPWDGHGLEVIQGVDVEEDDGDWIWCVFWSMGMHRCGAKRLQCDNWRDRVRNAWKMLRGKAVNVDEFIFERGEARRLGTHLLRLSGGAITRPRTKATGDVVGYVAKRGLK